MSSTTELEPTFIVEVPKIRPLDSLAAAASRLTAKKIKRSKKTRGFSAEGWQEDAWDMYDLVGEQRFLASTLANRMAQARFFVGKLPSDPTEDIEIVEEGVAADIGASIIGRGQSFSTVVQRAGVNLFIAGDGWLVGCPKTPVVEQKAQPGQRDYIGVEEEDPLAGIDIEDLQWKFYSVSEFKVDSQSGDVTLGKDRKVNVDQVVAIRVWRPHPRSWDHADSPTRSSLPVLRELTGLTMHVSAQVDSRLAGAGILLVPASADSALRAQAGATDDDVSPFAEALVNAMVDPIEDRSSASAVVPLTVVVPDEAIEKFKYLSFATPLDKESRELRDEAIRRLALGEDAPPELLLGVGGMNHWGAWLVREDVVTTHLEPPLALICDAITTQFLWPALEQNGQTDFEDYVFWYDVDHLITRPNRGADAKEAYRDGAIGDAAYRDAIGFDESDAPEADPTDPVTKLILDMIREAPSLAQNPGLDVLADQVRALVTGGTIPPLPEQAGSEGTSPAASPAESEEPAAGAIPNTEDNGAPNE